MLSLGKTRGSPWAKGRAAGHRRLEVLITRLIAIGFISALDIYIF